MSDAASADRAMTSDRAATRRSRVAAILTGGLATAVGWQAATTFHGSPYVFAIAGMLGAAGVGFMHRSVLAQVASRAAVYAVGTPLAMAVTDYVLSGSTPRPLHAAGVVAALGALTVARPLLHTAEARRTFAPARFRRTFLAGATAMATVSIIAVSFAVAGAVFGSTLQLVFDGCLAIVLALAVHGLLKMRTWGLLLGAFASLGLIAMTPFFGPVNAVTLSLSAAPALLFWVLPVLIARRASKEEPTRVRVEAEESLVRVVDEELLAAHGAVDDAGSFGESDARDVVLRRA